MWILWKRLKHVFLCLQPSNQITQKDVNSLEEIETAFVGPAFWRVPPCRKMWILWKRLKLTCPSQPKQAYPWAERCEFSGRDWNAQTPSSASINCWQKDVNSLEEIETSLFLVYMICILLQKDVNSLEEIETYLYQDKGESPLVCRKMWILWKRLKPRCFG